MYSKDYKDIKPYITQIQYTDGLIAIGIKTPNKAWEFIGDEKLEIQTEYVRENKTWVFLTKDVDDESEGDLITYIKTSIDFHLEQEQKSVIKYDLISEIEHYYSELNLKEFKNVKIIKGSDFKPMIKKGDENKKDEPKEEIIENKEIKDEK